LNGKIGRTKQKLVTSLQGLWNFQYGPRDFW